MLFLLHGCTASKVYCMFESLDLISIMYQSILLLTYYCLSEIKKISFRCIQ